MRIKRLLSLTLTLIILITTSFTGSLSTSAAMVTATDNHSVYSSDFSDPETLSDWCYTSEGDTTYDSLTATIEDGKFIFNNVNASGSFLRGMRYIPDKKSINQRVEITFTAQKGQKPCVWSRVNQEQMGKGNSLEGYYLMLNYNYSASTASLDLSKRVAAKNYSIATTNSVTMVDGQEYRLEMLCQGTNPTLISVALYTMVNGVDTVVCHNTFFDSEATLQTAGNAGMAGAKNGSASSDLKIDNFVYTSTDNVSGRYYVEEIVAGKNVTFGQAVYLDSTKKYVLSAHTVDVLDNNGYEYVNPLWIEYEPGGVNYRALTDRKLLSSNRSKEIATKAGITYNEYHTVFYNEFDLSELVAATDKKIKVIVGFRNDNSANTKGMFSHFSLYAADDPNKTNLLVNPDFKMGFYGWSDQAEFTKNTRMKEGESVGTYAKLSDSLSEYEYYNLFKNSTFTITEGDATGDGVVNLKDLVRTKKISSGISNYCVAVDYDSNGSISATNITYLRNQLLGIEYNGGQEIEGVSETHKIARIGYRPYDSSTPPEQSLASYRMAYENGYKILLCDVRTTSDGYFVALHDKTINRYATDSDGNRLPYKDDTPESEKVYINDITLAEADTYDFGIYKGQKYKDTKIMRVAEFLALCKELKVCPHLELKETFTEEKADELIAMVKEYGFENNIMFNGTYAENLRYIAGKLPNAVMGTWVNEKGITDTLIKQIATYGENNPKFIYVSNGGEATITAENYLKCLQQGIDIGYTEIRTEQELATIKSLGILKYCKYVATRYELD